MVDHGALVSAIERHNKKITNEAAHDIHYNARLYIRTPIISRDGDPDLFLAAEHLARATTRAFMCCSGVIDEIACVFEHCGFDASLDEGDLDSPTFVTAAATLVARLACSQAVADLDLAVTDNDDWASRAADGVWEDENPCAILRDTALGRQLAH